jgi:hypothetical protein
VIGSPVVGALSPQEQAAVEVAVRVLGVRAETGSDGIVLVYPDGRQAAFVEATVGDQREFELAHLRRESDLRWRAPARWWWQITVSDVRFLARVRDVFPVAARACEAHDVVMPSLLPAMVKAQIPDLHWLIHTAPARLLGHADVLDQPATVRLAPGPCAGDLDTVVPALEQWLATDQATRALAKLARSQADEWHLYLTVDYTGLAPNAFDALVRAAGLPSQQLQQPDISHLWVTPVFGRCVFLWSHRDGWSRHEPYLRRSDRP